MRIYVVKKPTVISTFAGCGGSSLGYKLAGYKELLAVEWDDNAVATFKLNFPEVPVYHGDITKLTGEECMRLAGIKAGELDVLDGSPPCQGFSTAGKRKYTDPRNSLFLEFARLVDELRPKVFVMENVTGMVKGVMKQAYLTIIKTLRDCGYRAKGEVMNAMYFNVPQSRERVIIIGARKDLEIEPTHPRPQGGAIILQTALDKAPDYIMPPDLKGKQREVMMAMKQGQSGEDVTGKGWFTHQRLSWKKVACTIQKEAWQFYHPTEHRNFSIGELRRIASFPDSFIFSGNWRQASARIGNSVPPNLMKAIAEHIKENILKAA